MRVPRRTLFNARGPIERPRAGHALFSRRRKSLFPAIHPVTNYHLYYYHYPPPFMILVRSNVLPHAHIPRASSHAKFFSIIPLVPETDRFPATPVGRLSSAHVGLKHRPLSVQITREIYNLLL